MRSGAFFCVRDLGAARALWELACQRWSRCGLSGRAQGCHRRQAGSHRYWGTARDLCAARALWELACQRWGICGLSGSAQGCHRRQAGSHRYCGHSPGFMCCAGLVGAGLPAMEHLRSVRQRAGMSSPASRLPQVLWSQPGIYVLRGSCGSWLASDGAVAVYQAERRRPAPPMDQERVKTPSASRCCFCVQPLWAHRRNNPGAGQSVGGCGKYPGAFRKWCTCATCDPGTGSRYCSCAAG